MASEQIQRIFSATGALGKVIPGFQPRAQQLEMADAVQRAIKGAQEWVIEAPTGTGKTFAYLIPALVANKKTVISTGSKNLQDQLFNRDLPTVVKALGYRGRTALLKGRGNYLCLERLEIASHQGVLGDKDTLADLKRIRKWRPTTETGDFAECQTVSEDSPIFKQLISTKESCLGRECKHWEDCFVMKARKRAIEADVVVANHHLFFSDMMVKDGGFGELLPQADVVIFDEAHQVPDIACQHLGESLSSHQIFDLTRDIYLIYRTQLKDVKQLGAVSDSVKKAAQDFRLAVGDGDVRVNWRNLAESETMEDARGLLLDKMAFAIEVLKGAIARSKDLENAYDRLCAMHEFLSRLDEQELPGHCIWLDTHGRHFALHITPLSVAKSFTHFRERTPSAWIFTSATLEVAGKFNYFCSRLGLGNAHTLTLSSPFDYENQALLCVPRFLPPNNQKDTPVALGKMLLPVIEQNHGRCFVLCTSNYMMQGLAAYFREHSELNVLMQGECPKGQLLDTFVNTENTVLVATSSFWEGIDVRGQALSLVIIDKLPFASPDDPLLEARIRDAKEKNFNAFNGIQIPEAVITLKQGVGRLIRDVADRGVIMICDSRLVMKNYGVQFLKSLPPAKRTRSLQNVVEFLTSSAQKKG